MKNLVCVVLIGLSSLFSQIVEWETSIPFDTTNDGPVGIDIDLNGNILVACYTNGPNESEWNVDTLTASPSTKVIKLDSYGNLIDTDEHGILFNDAVEGIAYTDNGYTLFGENKSYYYDHQTYYMPSTWVINCENDSLDTLIYSSYQETGFSLKKVKTTPDGKTAYNFGRSSELPGGSSKSYLMDKDNKLIFNADSLTLPDSIWINLKNQKFSGYSSIYDFDFDNNGNLYIIGQILNSTFTGYHFVMKIDPNKNTLWEIYYPITFGSTSFYYYSIASNSDGECLVSSLDHTLYYLDKYDSNGDVLYRYRLMKSIEELYYIGNNQYIGIEQSDNLIYKFTDTGSEIVIDWTIDMLDQQVIRPVDNGFIIAGIDNSEIVIKKFDATSGIENSSSIPSTATLYQNYPNPFNPVTEITYSITELSDVDLSVYNIKGEIVKSLVSSKKDKGNYSIKFNAEDHNSGIYFYKLFINGNMVSTKKMIFVK